MVWSRPELQQEFAEQWPTSHHSERGIFMINVTIMLRKALETAYNMCYAILLC